MQRLIYCLVFVFVVCGGNVFAAHENDDVLRLELSIIGTRLVDTVPQRSDVMGNREMEIQRGLPLTVRVELRNESDNQAVEVPDINPALDHIAFDLVDADGKVGRVVVYAWAQAGDHMPGVRRLGPGESIVWETFLFGILEPANVEGYTKLTHRYMFDRVGGYKLRASIAMLLPSELSLVSNEVMIRVDEVHENWQSLTKASTVESVELLRAGVLPSPESMKTLVDMFAVERGQEESSAVVLAFKPWIRSRQDQLEALIDPKRPESTK